MKKIRMLVLLLLLFSMLFCVSSTTAFAKEVEQPRSEVKTSYVNWSSRNFQVYTDIETKIYTGRGVDRWLHISPWNNPTGMMITMKDYNNTVVWTDFITGTDTTHWFVGANVHYIILQGGPGTVTVTVTEH